MTFWSGRISFFIAAVVLISADTVSSQDAPKFDSAWRRSAALPAREIFEINGTGDRNNPLRRRLEKPFAGDELFVRFRLRYDAKSIDTPAEKDGEFFVLWLDEVEGGDTAIHSGGVPNLGIHVAEGQNRFMVRYASRQEKFTKMQLEGDREFRIVGRLWKTRSGEDQPFDSLDIWTDPGPQEEFNPHASTTSRKSITRVGWIGFATGRKTEPSDRIQISDIGLAATWSDALKLPPKPTAPPTTKPVQVARAHSRFAGGLLASANCR